MAMTTFKSRKDTVNLCRIDTDSILKEEKESLSIDVSFCTDSHHDSLLPHMLQLLEWI